MKTDKTTLILGALGVGALIYFMMNRNQSTSSETSDKSTDGENKQDASNQPPSPTTPSIAQDIEKFYQYRAFDNQGKALISMIQRASQEKLMQSKEFFDFKSNKKDFLSKNFISEKELLQKIEEQKTNKNLPKGTGSVAITKMYSPNEITLEMVTKATTNKLDKGSKKTQSKGKTAEELYPLVAFALEYNKGALNANSPKAQKKSATSQLDEAQEFLGMCNY